jgi:two-component system cell cycle sensor histidine kinase/response regulator CckA
LDSAIEAIEIGVLDYIVKPITDFKELNLRVQNAVEKVQLRRQLRESEERYRGMFDASFDAILFIDAETEKIHDINAAAERLYGFARNELIGMEANHLEVTVPSVLARPPLIETRHRHKNGHTLDVEIASLELSLQGRRMVLRTIRDLSERRRAAEERLELEEFLRQSQKMEAIGRLAGGIAHDFNNLLTAIIGNTDILSSRMPEKDQGQIDSLEAILEASRRAAALIRRLLVFSAHKPLSPTSLDINAVIEQMRQIMLPTIGAGIQLRFRLPSDAWNVFADSDELGQVLLNLAVNARDAMPGGGIIDIETENRTLGASHPAVQKGLTPGDYVALVVRDNGTGIPPDVLDRIFEPYFTTKAVGKGTGLGLATVYGIVQKSGGTISVSSTVGQGTSFEILFPRGEPEAMQLNPATEAKAS